VGIDEQVEQCVAALRGEQPVLLPTDTVYGLCTSAASEAASHRVYQLKGRAESQPTAVLASSVEQLLEAIPELRGDVATIVHTLLPGPFTLVLPNPARRFRWLAGTRTDAIGVRVPDLPEASRQVVDIAGPLLATSANDPGGPNPATLADVPQRIRDGCGAELDLGALPGTPSTVIDFTGAEPYVIRDGIAPAAEALARVREALAG